MQTNIPSSTIMFWESYSVKIRGNNTKKIVSFCILSYTLIINKKIFCLKVKTKLTEYLLNKSTYFVILYLKYNRSLVIFIRKKKVPVVQNNE